MVAFANVALSEVVVDVAVPAADCTSCGVASVITVSVTETPCVVEPVPVTVIG